MLRIFTLVLLIFFANIALASKPAIPWELALQLETVAEGKFKLVTQLTSQRELQGISVTISSHNVQLLSGTENWIVDIESGETKEFVLDYSASTSRGIPQWKALATVNYGGVRMSRTATVTFGGTQKKVEKRNLNIRQGAEEYYVK